MKKDELFKRITANAEKGPRPDRQNPTSPNEEIDPYVARLIAEGLHAINELDPIVREKFRDDPAALAEWDEIMHMCDDLDEDPETGKASELPH